MTGMGSQSPAAHEAHLGSSPVQGTSGGQSLAGPRQSPALVVLWSRGWHALCRGPVSANSVAGTLQTGTGSDQGASGSAELRWLLLATWTSWGTC